MTTYYVGPGGSDAANGLSWANRKLTLNGAEDIPVAAGDTVYVGPGVYRETLTCDVSGSAGNIITYIADVTGENTDGVGGAVRITGSDNDQSATRAANISASNIDYRTFRGFSLDTTTTYAVLINNDCDDWIVEDCFFDHSGGDGIRISGTPNNVTIRRCLFLPNNGAGCLYITNGTVHNDSNITIENCIMIHPWARGIRCDRVGGIIVKNCYFSCVTGARIFTALDTGQTLTVNNSIIAGCNVGLQATTTAEFVENYNTFYANQTNRSNVNTGANSIAYPPLFAAPILLSGYIFPWRFGELSKWSLIAARLGTGEPTLDLFGKNRPTTASKNSWGPIQDVNAARDTGTVRTGTASIKLPDAGRVQFFVPVTAVSTTISVYVQRETNYAGTNPQMVIKQPGVADDTTTDAGSASAWNELTTTLTPSNNTDFVIVELVSNNTATSGSYAVYFDDLTVS